MNKIIVNQVLNINHIINYFYKNFIMNLNNYLIKRREKVTLINGVSKPDHNINPDYFAKVFLN